MANRFAVKSAILTFGGTAFDMASGPTRKGEKREAVDVTALSDTIKQFIKGALKEQKEFTVSLYDKGSGMPTVDDSPAALSIAVTLDNGIDSPISASVSFNRVIVTDVSDGSMEAAGDRKAVVDVTFQPDGSVAASTGGGPGNPA